ESLDPKWTLAQAMTGGSGDTVTVGDESRHVIGYMKDFLFRPEQARTPVSVLSGGERARLTLARALARPSNLPRSRRDVDCCQRRQRTLDRVRRRLHRYAGSAGSGT